MKDLKQNNCTILTRSTTRSEDVMKSPEFVEQILTLSKLGWGKKRIAKELGTTVRTVRRYLALKQWVPYQRTPASRLSDVQEWLEESFLRHQGNAAVVHQELRQTHGINVSLRTVERALKPLRESLKAQTKATVRFETEPGKQLQIDFGSSKVVIDGQPTRVHFFVATLGYSRRPYVCVFSHERQSSWFRGLEQAFYHFDGVPEHVLMDNPRSLIDYHNPRTREVKFNDRFLTFSTYWRFKPKACAPYRARTKGKDESGVKYVKRNCIAGREFTSWEHLNQHLQWWMREIADQRIHGTTGEKPIDRFERDEAIALTPVSGRPPFCQMQDFKRKVHNDSCIELDTNHYSVPWKYIGQMVTVNQRDGGILITAGTKEIARHRASKGQRERVVDFSHLDGVVGANWAKHQQKERQTANTLLRPLSAYEAVVGGGW